MKKALALLLLPVSLAVGACSGGAGEPTASPSARVESSAANSADKPNVVVAFYGLEYAANQVAGDLVNISMLTAPGADAHGTELKPSQLKEITEADLVVYLKQFQPAVDEAITQSGNPKVLDVSEVVKLLPVDHKDDHDHDTHKDDHDHDTHKDDHDHDTHKDDHDHGDFDPHFWQDPLRLAQVGDAIAHKLGDGFPALKEQLAKGASEFSNQMTALDGEFAKGLASCERKTFITSHQAFNYLAEKYGLTEIGISGINPDDEPSPARIAEVQRLAKEHNVTTIFFETLTSPAVSEAIAGDLGLKTAVLDPLEGITANSPGKDYPSIMRANLSELKTANGC
ncbi:metal ABC transporter substrate-binding protein [Tessaracoccus sp. OH4464_COT-324]|uniref:metal ABC transporter substrate-binding protein n=1 Tax=Tessaracoccus sp. OH4464_COT-324 TaxID=2491059 RepID=UPI001F214FC3|nr:metal ABC transporter substrate-binding protein [Tessaracoccus sp. OH4464_COT-324]